MKKLNVQIEKTFVTNEKLLCIFIRTKINDMDKHLNYYEVRWKNFKSFTDTKWIKIKPLTIVLGSNNSGKTNFLAPFLLMNQTLMSKDPNSPLIIKGSSYDGGNIKELVSDYDLSKNIFFGFRYHLHETDEKIEKVGSYLPGAVEVTFGVNNKKDREIIVKKETVSDIFRRNLFSISRIGKKYKLTEKGFKSLSRMYEHETDSIANSSPLNFLFEPNSLLSDVRERNSEITTRKKKKISVAFSDLLDATSFNFSTVRQYLGELSYIGPIRDNPHRIYEISNENYYTVGSKGENMTNLLKKHFSKRNKELDKWIKKFRFGDWLELEHLYGNSYSIRFKEEKNPELYTSIANSGFGASQLLPLIVQALVSPKGSLTIAEQPEVHLNPLLQCELADLFSFMANKDQKVIIETHSEYLLLRLRRLVADKTISADNIAIYFVEKIDGSSNIREIKMQEDGHIKPEEWPSDFFVDSLRESLLLATQQLKNKK